jgi:hypothetical protein
LSIDAKRELDSLFDCGHRVAVLDEQHDIQYLRFKSPVPFVAPRDFCLRTHWSVEADGTFIFLAYSDSNVACPPVKV